MLTPFGSCSQPGAYCVQACAHTFECQIDVCGPIHVFLPRCSTRQSSIPVACTSARRRHGPSLPPTPGGRTCRCASQHTIPAPHPSTSGRVPEGQGKGKVARGRCSGTVQDRLRSLETARDTPRPRRILPSGPCTDSRTTARLPLGSSGWTRTNNPAVNSRTLCQLSYRGLTGPGLYMDRTAEPKNLRHASKGQAWANRLFLRLMRASRCCSSAAVRGGCRNGLLSLTYIAHRVYVSAWSRSFDCHSWYFASST